MLTLAAFREGCDLRRPHRRPLMFCALAAGILTAGCCRAIFRSGGLDTLPAPWPILTTLIASAASFLALLRAWWVLAGRDAKIND